MSVFIELLNDSPRVSSVLAGAAAEHLVCADLLMRGVPVARVESRPYDLIAESPYGLCRIQVKGRQRPVPSKHRSLGVPVYSFDVTSPVAGSRKKLYSLNSCDIVALVAIDRKEVAYLRFDNRKPRYRFYVDRWHMFQARTFEKAVEDCQLREFRKPDKHDSVQELAALQPKPAAINMVAMSKAREERVAASQIFVHREGCSNLGRMHETSVEWIDVSEAKSRGYQPCSRCRPWSAAD